MNPKFKYLFKNTGILAISNFSSKILVFFMVPLYTSVLTTKEYGVIDLIFSTIGFVLPILTLNIKSSVMIFAMDKSQAKQEVATIGFIFELIGCLIFSLFVYINKFFQWFEFAEHLEFIVIFYLFSQAFLQYISNLARGLERVLDLGIAGVIGTLTSIIFNIYFLLYLKLGFFRLFLCKYIVFNNSVTVFLYSYKNMEINTL